MTPAPNRLLRFARHSPVALGRNEAHRFAADHALSLYPAQAIYSFIPKNGCSTLRLSMAMFNGAIAGPQDVAWIHANNGTFIATRAELATARYSFCVLRCPFRRLASVFLDKIVGERTRAHRLLRKRAAAGPPVQALFDRVRRGVAWRLGVDLPVPDDLSFRRFIDLLEAPGALQADHHWRPQVDFLVYETYDDLFRLEDFRTAVTRLHCRIGFQITDARRLTGHGTDTLRLETSGSFADHSLTQLSAMKSQGRAPAPALFYDAGLIARVRQLYDADIALYARQFGEDGLLFPQPGSK